MEEITHSRPNKTLTEALKDKRRGLIGEFIFGLIEGSYEAIQRERTNRAWDKFMATFNMDTLNEMETVQLAKWHEEIVLEDLIKDYSLSYGKLHPEGNSGLILVTEAYADSWGYTTDKTLTFVQIPQINRSCNWVYAKYQYEGALQAILPEDACAMGDVDGQLNEDLRKGLLMAIKESPYDLDRSRYIDPDFLYREGDLQV